jgi:hypothetical protein
MCYEEDFGTICDLGFGRLEAGVICSQLGYSRMGNALQHSESGVVNNRL